MRRLALIGVLGLLCASCASDEDQPERPGAVQVFEAVADALVARWISGEATPPTPRSEVAFQDDQSFDAQLWSSLRNASGVPNGSVRVTLPDGTRDAPARLTTWLRKVGLANNRMITCEVPDTEGSVITVIEILLRVWDEVSPIARQYAVYAPAGDFNAIIETEATSQDLVAVRFISVATDFDRYALRYTSCAR